MAGPKRPRFFNQYAGNFAQRVFRAGVNGLFPGEQRAPDGTLQNVGKGALGFGAKAVAGALLGPAGAFMAGKVADTAIDSNGLNWIPFGKGPVARWAGYGPQDQLNSQLSLSQQQMQQAIDARGFGAAPNINFASDYGNGIGPVTKQQIGLLGDVYAGNVGGQPSMNVPTMGPVQAQAPWGGSLGGRNPFGGSYGSNLGFTSPATRSFGRAAGSFTPNGAGAIEVAGNGWAGSDAAAGFGLGAQGAGASSAGSIALSDAIALHKKFAR